MNHFGSAAPAAQAIIWPFNNPLRRRIGQAKNFCLTACFLLAVFTAQAAIKTWDGSASTDWNVADNWTPVGVPVAGDVVEITNVPANQPVIFSGTMAKAARVIVYYNSSLTINAGGELELASALTLSALDNGGTVTNNGTLKVKSGFQGIDNDATFINNGTIRLGEATSSPYAFTEEGIALYANGGNFVNNSTGIIVILRPGNNGILLFATETSFTNYGKITVRNAGLNPATAATADGIDARGGDFLNETTGEVVISSITANGVHCRVSGSFTNDGNVKIGNVGLTTALDFREGINNTSLFYNTDNGQITIDTCTNNGILNQGVIHNGGDISIGAAKANSITNLGLGNLAGFFNYAGATLTVKNTVKSGILSGGLGGVLTNYPGGTITIGSVGEDGISQLGLGGTDNRGTLNIGSTGNIARYAINNACQFLNQSGATLTITNTTNTAIFNTSAFDVDGLFKNGGKVVIDNSAHVGGTAILNTVGCAFENLSCGSLLRITSNNTISNAGTFTNEGNIIENASGNSSVTTNSGTIQNLNGGTFSVTGSNTGVNSTATGAIWTGCDNTNWANLYNWNGLAVPVAADNVLIPSSSNDPTVFGGTAAVAKSVTVRYSAVLTLNTSASLTIGGSTTTGLFNGSTVNNAGTLNISNTGGVGFHNTNTLIGYAQDGSPIYGGGIFNNNSGGVLAINNTAGDGIFLEGASLNNFAQIKIGNTGSIGGDGIESRGSTLDNKSSGEITVDRTTADGIFIFSNPMTNAGKITIGGTAAIGVNGITNGNIITNSVGGEIKIDRTAQQGISNSFATFNNYGMLKIGSVAAIGSWGIGNQNGNFNNYSTGEITIDRTGQNGIYNYYNANNRAFGNSGKIFIGKTAAITGHGILNEGTFNNNADGEITIDRSTNNGIYVSNDNDSNTLPAAFNNSGNLTIGGTASIGDNGIRNRVTFNNNTGGDIKIDRSSGDGLQNFQGTFSNAAKITIGATVAPTGDGLENAATFNNQACGEIALFDNLNNSGTFTNAGLLRMNTALAHSNSSTFTNDGIIEYPQGSLIPNVTNNDVIVQAVSGECPVANALQIGGSNIFTIGSTWYKNTNLTTPAGTYDAGTNTFTANGLADGSTTTLYFTVSDGSNGCTRTVSIRLTYDDVTKPTIACPADQTVEASGACSGTVGTRVLVSKSDNCTASGSISEIQSPASNTVLGGHNDVETVTFTANDGNGNTQTCQFTVTLKDVSKPTITCPADQTVEASGTCSGTVGTRVLVSKSDNCTASGSISEIQSPASNTVLSGHNDVETVTLTANDGNGNTQTCQFTVTLKDVTQPTITCPADQTVAADGACSATIGDRTGLATNLTDNCTASGGITVVQSPATNTLLSGHNDFEIVTLKSDDGNGNQSQPCTFQVILKDITPPGITCPANIAKTTDAGQCSAVTTYSVTASDNCAYTLTRTSPAGTASGSSFPLGTTNVAWSVTDEGSNATSCAFTVTVTDAETPTITCPANIAKSTDAGQCSAVTNYTVTASDNCSYTLTRTNGQPSGTAFPTGTNVVNWRVTDVAGLTAICSFTITVTDGQLPSIVCPGNISKTTDPGQCGAVITYATPTFSDNCAGAYLTRTSGQASGTAFPTGTHTVNWNATDLAGNSSVCNFIVIVTDGQAPSITCPANLVKNADAGLCTAVVTYANPTYSDNCTGAGIDHISGGLSGSTFPKGTTSVIWQATDVVNLTKRCTFTVTVNDAQAPTIACPSNQTKAADAGICTAVVNYTTPTFTDNCAGGGVAIQSGMVSGSAFPKGQTTVVWKATDAAGLTKTCSFKVTVNDTQAPTFTLCPSSQSVNMDAGQCTAAVTYATPTASDNCTPPPTVVKQSGLASGSAFPKGSNTVVWKATDGAGLTKTCSFTVTVTDTQLPTITCPSNIAVTGSGPSCNAVVSYANPTVTDNCAITSNYLLSGLGSGAQFSQGVTTNIWKATDNSGLTATCAFTVTVSCGAAPETMNYERGTMNDQSAGNSSFIVHHLSFTLAPNPATTQVQVMVEGLSENGGEITVLDAQGRMVWQQSVLAQHPAVTLDVSGDKFAAGVYFVALRAEGKTVTKRLIVTKL